MKKFLSMVLALVMIMSLVTVGAGAKDFTDDSKINYEEAVDVMTAVKVLDGYADGSFNPQGGLTRGAAAKIICNMILGPTTAAALNADTAPYKDVPVDHTFAGYIAYCAKEGIISGYADGTFRPAAPLTGYAFMKMLLGALGYDSAVEGYVGSNWSINVAKRALNIGLNKGLIGEFVGSKALNREEAALYAFNAMMATMVEYKNSSTIVVGDITVTTNSTATEVEVGENVVETIKNDDKMQFAEKYFSNLKKTTTTQDDFGRPAHEWKYKKTSVGVYAETPDAAYTKSVKGKGIYEDLNNTAFDFQQVEQTEAIFVDGVQIGVDDDVVDAEFAVAKGNDESIGGNGVLTEVYVIEGAGDAEDTVRIVMINTYFAQVTSDYDKDDEELDIDILGDFEFDDIDETLKLDDLSNIDEFEEDDYVLITVAFNGTEQYVASIEKVEPTTGSVTNFESDYDTTGWMDEKDTVTADGEKYSYTKTFTPVDETFDCNYKIKGDYDFYLDNYGYVISVDGVEADAKYVYIDAFEASGLSSKATLKGYAYFTDGKTDLISIKTINDAEVKGMDAIEQVLGELLAPTTNDGEDEAAALADEETAALEIANGLFTYTEKDGKYELTTVEVGADDTAMAPAIQLNGEEEVELTAADALDLVSDAVGGVVRGSKNTVFIVIDDDDEVEVYTGIKNVPVITIGVAEEGDDNAYIAVEDDSSSLYAKYVFIDLGDVGSTNGRVKGGDVLFLYEDTYAKKGTDADDNVYYTYKAIKDGELTTVKFNDENDELDPGLYTGVKYDEDGYACKATPVTDPIATAEDYSADTFTNGIIEKKGDVITVWEGETASEGFYMADKCDVTFIYDEEVKSITWKNVGEEGKYVVDAIYTIMNSDDECTSLFIMVSDAPLGE